jgi:hypothetical protein
MNRITHKRSVLHTNPAQGGYALLIAAVISSIIVTIVFGVSNIVTRQIIFSSMGRESHIAFYMSENALWCAYYWDAVHGAFSGSDPASSIACGGDTNIELMQVGGGLEFTWAEEYGSTRVRFDPNIGGRRVLTARGYNVSEPDPTHPRLVERGVLIRY